MGNYEFKDEGKALIHSQSLLGTPVSCSLHQESRGRHHGLEMVRGSPKVEVDPEGNGIPGRRNHLSKGMEA